MFRPIALALAAGALAFVVGGVLLATSHVFIGIIVALSGLPLALAVWMTATDR